MTMNNLDACMSSKFLEWETPRGFFEEIDKRFNFTLDFCASKDNTKCKRYYSKEEDALQQNPKGEVIFCNPPYGNEIKKFVKKCYEISKNNTVVMLIPARTDTTYWHEYIFPNAKIEFIKGRIKFNKNEEESNSAPFPSALVIFKGEPNDTK